MDITDGEEGVGDTAILSAELELSQGGELIGQSLFEPAQRAQRPAAVVTRPRLSQRITQASCQRNRLVGNPHRLLGVSLIEG